MSVNTPNKVDRSAAADIKPAILEQTLKQTATSHDPLDGFWEWIVLTLNTVWNKSVRDEHSAQDSYVMLYCPPVAPMSHFSAESFLRSFRFIMVTVKTGQVPFCGEPVPPLT